MARSVWFIGAPVELAGEVGLPELGEAVRWTGTADRHLTLCYLGRVDDDLARAAWPAVPPFDLPHEVRALRWERFGRGALAIVLDDPAGRLATAAAACHEAVGSVMAIDDPPSPYRPHVTLGRIRRRARPPSATIVAGWPVPTEAGRIGAPTLYRTRPPGDADRYEPVARQATP